MKDYAIDPETFDLLPVGPDGGFQIVEGVQAFAQRLRIRFQFFRGDWALNPEEGMPLVEEMLAGKVTPLRAETVLRQTVESTPGFRKMISFESSVDPTTRRMSIRFICVFETGEIVNFDEAFIIG